MCRHGVVLPPADASGWLLLLLSPLLSARVTQWSGWLRQPGAGVCPDRPWTRRGCRTVRAAICTCQATILRRC